MKREQITKDSIDRVAKRTGLPLDRYDQDWFVMMVTANDAPRLIESYDSFEKPVDKTTLIWFTISAYDKYLRYCIHKSETADPGLERKLTNILRENWAEHEDVVEYWGCLDYGEEGTSLKDEAEGFAVTPMMRRLWNEHEQKA